MPDPVLALDDVVVRFNALVALDEVSMSVGPGEICGLIGPNGAGKTTLFDVVSGVRRPDRGTVRLQGRDITSLRPSSRARLGVRRTFQRVQTFGWLSVEDNVLVASEWRGGGGGFVGDLVASPTRRRRERTRRQAATTAIERCDLSSVRTEMAGSLPIGISRMVEFARATVEPPTLLLLDEPASGLDHAESALLGRQIQQVRSETGCSVIIVEHDAGFIMEHCDRVVVLSLGSVLAEGSPSEIRNNPAVQVAYLGEGSLDGTGN
jgi:branched-chain amino acid transport system ATP-binding protein